MSPLPPSPFLDSVDVPPPSPTAAVALNPSHDSVATANSSVSDGVQAGLYPTGEINPSVTLDCAPFEPAVIVPGREQVTAGLPRKRHTAETRIGACADYLLGKPWCVIDQWGVNRTTVAGWIRKTGHFKMRHTHRVSVELHSGLSEPKFPARARSKPYVGFQGHKSDAKKRGVRWELSLEQWCNIWRQSGKWEQRGCRHDCYVMCRKGDVGPYSVDNVFIALARQNSSDHPNKKKDLPMGVFPKRKSFHAARKINGKRFYLGTYSTAAQAHAAYLACGGEA